MLQHLVMDASYMAHGYCLLWKPWLVSLQAGSDLLIALSYFAIPVAIWIFIRKRPNLEMRGLATMFAAFILCCGITHVIEVVTLWVPVYELQGYVKAVTAAVSLATAFIIFPLIPRALAIPSPAELMAVNDRLTKEIADHKQTLAELEQAKRDLQQTIDRQASRMSQTERQFRAIQEASPDGFVILDAARDEHGVIVDFQWAYANLAAEKIIDHDREGLIDKSLLQVMPWSIDNGRFAAYCRVVETGETWQSEFHYDHKGKDVWLRASAVKTDDGVAISYADISNAREQEQQIKLLMREVNHRSKNLLAVVEAIIRITAKDTDSEKLVANLSERLHGLAASNDLIVQGGWRNVDLKQLIKSQLGFLGKSLSTRVAIEGTDILISARAAQGIGLAMHELATNAMKYGALSNDAGMVEITWSVDASDRGPLLFLRWYETGGPTVSAPRKRGFGRTVIEKMVAQAVDAEVKLDFRRRGVRWELRAPLESIGS